MNSRINKLNIEDVLFFDIETVRGKKELEVDTKEYSAYEWKNRNKETDEFLPQDELLQHYKKKAALLPTFSKIVCISLGYVREGKIVIMSITGEEQAVITEFLAIVSKSKAILCGWNIIGFDLPTLRKRAFASGLREWNIGKANDSGAKPWTLAEGVLDLMVEYKGTSFYNESLEEACLVFNVPTPKDSINGSMVSEEYWTNGVDNISEYCQKDVIACINVLLQMKGLDLITDENVIYKDNIEIKEMGLVEEVMANAEVSEAQIEAVKDMVQSGDIRKEVAEDILTAAVGDKKSKVEL